MKVLESEVRATQPAEAAVRLRLLRPLVLSALVCGALVATLYAPVVPALVRDWWDDPNYSHGFIVPFFSLYLLSERRESLRTIRIEGSWLGLLVLGAGLGMHLLGVIGAEDFLTRSSLVVVLAGLVLLLAGREAFRESAFAIGFLLFMVPLPFLVFNSVAFPLQRIAAFNAAWFLDAVGIPVFRDGNVIHLTDVTLGVTEACSGIRSLISLLALAVVWAHLALRGKWSKILFVASAVPITILANAGRVIGTGLIAQYVSPAYATGFFHEFSGWVIFLVAGACLFLVQKAIELAWGSTTP